MIIKRLTQIMIYRVMISMISRRPFANTYRQRIGDLTRSAYPLLNVHVYYDQNTVLIHKSNLSKDLSV